MQQKNEGPPVATGEQGRDDYENDCGNDSTDLAAHPARTRGSPERGQRSRRPSFQFYPDDWLANAKLRRCSAAERGIWIDIICLMADGEHFGILRWPLKDIARAVSCSVAALRPLIERRVLKGADRDERCEPLTYVPRHARKDGLPVTLIPEQVGPIWYSSRMVVDEYKRRVRGENHGEE